MGYAIYKIATVGHLTTSKPNTLSKLIVTNANWTSIFLFLICSQFTKRRFPK